MSSWSRRRPPGSRPGHRARRATWRLRRCAAAPCAYRSPAGPSFLTAHMPAAQGRQRHRSPERSALSVAAPQRAHRRHPALRPPRASSSTPRSRSVTDAVDRATSGQRTPPKPTVRRSSTKPRSGGVEPYRPPRTHPDERLQRAHNPKVAGSNPAPATQRSPAQEAVAQSSRRVFSVAIRRRSVQLPATEALRYSGAISQFCTKGDAPSPSRP